MCVAMVQPTTRRLQTSKYDGQPQPARPCGHVGDVGHPQLVGPRGREVTIHQVRSGRRLGVPLRRRRLEAPPGRALDPQAPHQPPHALLAHRLALGPERRVDPRTAVRLATPGPGRPDPRLELRVPSRARRGRMLEPIVVAAGGETQHPAHGRQRKLGPVRLHEHVPPPGIDPLSLAGHRRIAVVRPRLFFRDVTLRPKPLVLTLQAPHFSPRLGRQTVAPLPLVQLRLSDPVRIACSEGSNSRASEPGLRPARASSTSRSRYSGGYRPALAATTHLPGWPNGKVSVKTGQLQRYRPHPIHEPVGATSTGRENGAEEVTRCPVIPTVLPAGSCP